MRNLASLSTADGLFGRDSGPVPGNVHKTYDSNLRLSNETVIGGQTINFGYDNDDLLTAAGAMTITRDPATGFVTATDSDAIHETRTYDAYGAEQTYTVAVNGTTLYSADYGTRDAIGRIVTKTETIQGTTHVFGYTYDPNGRLTDVTTDGNATSHYSYDSNGNRLVGPRLSASPVYDYQDRLLSYGNCTYTYKNDGSLQTKTCPAGNTAYDYDAFGNLRSVTLPSGATIAYVIDGQNRRIGKKVNNVLVEGFLYRSQLQPAAWLDGTGALKATFVYAGGNAPAYMLSGGRTYRYMKDQLGTVREVVDSSTGAVAQRIDYDEFGNVLADSAPGFQPFGFAGGLRDLDTGLTRFGARDYDSATGRWTVKDPLRFRGGLFDLYAYVNSDPINRKDPSGLQARPLGPPPPPLELVPPLPPVPYASTAPGVLDWLASGQWGPWLAPVAVLLTPSPIGRDRCSEAYPGMIECDQLGPDFKFDTEAEAFTLAEALNPGVQKHKREEAKMCQGGTHVNLRCGKDRAGSLTCCPCCEDTITGILTQNKCAYIP